MGNEPPELFCNFTHLSLKIQAQIVTLTDFFHLLQEHVFPGIKYVVKLDFRSKWAAYGLQCEMSLTSLGWWNTVWQRHVKKIISKASSVQFV